METLKKITLDLGQMLTLVIGFLIGYVTGVITSRFLKAVLMVVLLLFVVGLIYFKYFVKTKVNLDWQ